MFKTNFISVIFFRATMEERIRLSETRQYKAISPNTLNANNILFGGQAMQMDGRYDCNRNVKRSCKLKATAPL
jgi:hypothetical protein